ncbi:kinase-like domain-containing protein, partial [Glomus cerebriforme]
IHGNNLIHGDLSSRNIFLSDNSLDGCNCPSNHLGLNTFIGDFGLSRLENLSNYSENVYGNTRYLAPEVLNCNPYTKESDMYSFGMIMWEYTSSKKPFHHLPEEIHIMYAILDGKRPEITEDTPKCYAEFMKKCWDPDPKKRPS